MKPKVVTTQMKTLDEYFLMVVFTLLLNRAHVFGKFHVSFEQRNMAVKGFKNHQCEDKINPHSLNVLRSHNTPAHHPPPRSTQICCLLGRLLVR